MLSKIVVDFWFRSSNILLSSGKAKVQQVFVQTNKLNFQFRVLEDSPDVYMSKCQQEVGYS